MTVVLALVLLVVLVLPLVLGWLVLVDRALVADGHPTIRRPWWVRVWWWYGYHGLYQAQWRYRWLRAGPDGPQCSAGAWEHGDDGTMFGWVCSRRNLHPGAHAPVPDRRPAPPPDIT